MANSDVLVRMKADTQNYDANIAKARRQLDQFRKDNLSLGGVMKQSANALTGLAAQYASAAAALKVLKDAFTQTEGGADSFNAAIESCKASYSVLLNTLNNGNWSSFFQNLNDAITGANKLYDAMDRLGSIKANNAAAIAREQATIQELRLRQEKGENVAKELAAAEDRLKKLQMQAVNQGKVAGQEQMKQVLTNSVNSIAGNGRSFLGFTIKQDTTAKVTEEDIDKAVQDILKNGQDAFDKYATQYAELKTKGTKTVTNYSQGGQAYQTKEFDISILSKEEQALYKLAKAVTDSEGNLKDGINTFATALQEGAAASREARKTEVAIKKEQAEVAKPQTKAEEKVTKALEDYATSISVATIRKEAGLDDEEKYKNNELAAHERLFNAYTEAYNLYADPKYKAALDEEAKQILALAKVSKELKDAKEEEKIALRQQMAVDSHILGGLTSTAKSIGWTAADLGTTGLKTKINAGIDITEDEWKVFEDKINERLKELHLDPISIDFETGNIETVAKGTASAWQNAAAAVANVGSALQTIEDPAAKVTGILMQAIAQIALGFAQATASPATGAAGVFGWIAATTAGLATMASTIAAIKSVTAGSYAEGGVVGGNSYSGDRLMAYVNSGETILNQRQAQTVLDGLQGSAAGGGSYGSYVSGETIVLGVNNYFGRSGQGEIVTTSMLRRAGINI